MKIRSVLFMAIIAVVLIIGSCSDDECPNCPEPIATVVPSGLAIGWAYLQPAAVLTNMSIVGNNGSPPNVDSIIFGDSVLAGRTYINYVEDSNYYGVIGWDVAFTEGGSSYMYSHGDSATLSIYGEGKNADCKFVILSVDSASINITGTDKINDSIGQNDSITVYWNKVDKVDFYGISMQIRKRLPSGFSEWYDRFDKTIDTSFTVIPEMLHDSTMFFYVTVTPFTGPDPFMNSGNIASDWMAGSIYSLGTYNDIYITGWMPPVNIGVDVPPDDIINRKQYSVPEIINGIRETVK